MREPERKKGCDEKEREQTTNRASVFMRERGEERKKERKKERVRENE